MSAPFRRVLRGGETGLDCLAVKRALKKAGFRRGINLSHKFGPKAVENLKRFQHAHSLKADGVYGRETHRKLTPAFDKRGEWLLQHAKVPHPRQVPPLPRLWPASVFGIDNGGGSGKWRLQPALVPQVEAICRKFGLTVTAGYGGHPPHAYRSDHRVGLAVDLAGGMRAMQDCNLWADGLRGHTFRWVGGPAHDSDGVERGHSNHVHLSWYRTHPTTIFGTSRFKD